MPTLLALSLLALLSGCTMATGLVTEVRPQDDGSVRVTKCDLVYYFPAPLLDQVDQAELDQVDQAVLEASQYQAEYAYQDPNQAQLGQDIVDAASALGMAQDRCSTETLWLTKQTAKTN